MPAFPPPVTENPVSTHGPAASAARRANRPPPLEEPYFLFSPSTTIESTGSNATPWDSWSVPGFGWETLTAAASYPVASVRSIDVKSDPEVTTCAPLFGSTATAWKACMGIPLQQISHVKPESRDRKMPPAPVT